MRPRICVALEYLRVMSPPGRIFCRTFEPKGSDAFVGLLGTLFPRLSIDTYQEVFIIVFNRCMRVRTVYMRRLHLCPAMNLKDDRSVDVVDEVDLALPLDAC